MTLIDLVKSIVETMTSTAVLQQTSDLDPLPTHEENEMNSIVEDFVSRSRKMWELDYNMYCDLRDGYPREAWETTKEESMDKATTTLWEITTSKRHEGFKEFMMGDEILIDDETFPHRMIVNWTLKGRYGGQGDREILARSEREDKDWTACKSKRANSYYPKEH